MNEQVKEKCDTNNSCKVSVDRALRGIAGVLLIISIVLTQLHSPNWMYFSAFIGINLVQSAFTNWCPMMTILRRVCGLK